MCLFYNVVMFLFLFFYFCVCNVKFKSSKMLQSSTLKVVFASDLDLVVSLVGKVKLPCTLQNNRETKKKLRKNWNIYAKPFF